VQRHLPDHLPGTPPIVVENVPGAGSLKSVQYMESLPSDGTAIVTFSSGLLTEAITAPNRVKIDFRQQGWIGNVSEDARVCYLWHTTGVRNWQDFVARKQVVFAASAPGTAGYVDAAMLRELFGVHLRQVNGYPGSADMRLAVERGEVDGGCGGWTAMPEDWLRGGNINVVVRLSPTLLPGMAKNVPFAGDLTTNERERAIFNFLMAPEKLGRLFMVSGKVPPKRVDALRRAFDLMLVDPAFLRDAESRRLTIVPMTGDEIAREIAALYAASAEVIARAKKIAGE
jgi:tripartite-type tricarboxylate transporter receptor subunit TctC